MTWGEIYKQFLKKYPKIKAIDYRPYDPFYLPEKITGIIMWLKNGDTIVYIPKKQEDKDDDSSE